jgi:hypothetical protein
MAAVSAQERFAAQLAAAGITPEKPLHAVLWAVHDSALAGRDAAEFVRERVVGEVGQAVRGSLYELKPAFEQRWRWQRWAAMVVAFAVGCATMGLVGLAAWQASAAVERHEAAKEIGQWQAWCAAPGHQVVIAGKPVCQVPLQTQ